MTDMFAPLRYPPGTTLLIPWNQIVTFTLADFLPIYNNTPFEAVFDFGPGMTYTVKSTDANWSFPFNCTEVLALTMRVLYQYGPPENRLRLRMSWPVQIGVPASEFSRASVLPFVGVAQATFALPVGARQALMPLLSTASVGSSGMPGGSSGQPGTVQPMLTAFPAALDGLSRRLQQAFASGFGRIAVPSAPVDRSICVHLSHESLVYGTSSDFQSDLAAVEFNWSQALQDPSRADALDTMMHTIQAIGTLYPDLRDLGRTNLTGGEILVPGPHSIHGTDVAVWHMYATGAVDAAQTLGALPLGDWDVHQGAFDRNLPDVDWHATWRWLVVQQVVEAVSAFYQALGIASSRSNANVLITATPGSNAYSLRLFDMESLFWLQVALAETGSAGHVELTDMAADGQNAAQPGGGYVAARAVGMVGLASSTMPPIFDVGAVIATLDGSAFAKAPTVQTLDPGSIGVYRESTGMAVARSVAPDGTSTVVASNDRLAVLTIASPAVALPDAKDAWVFLEPHALLSVRKGQMLPVMRRG